MSGWNSTRKVYIPDCEPKKRVFCEVCGSEIEFKTFRRYEVLEHITYNFLLQKPIETPGNARMYDAFDCPVCGCQFIAKERLRSV